MIKIRPFAKHLKQLLVILLKPKLDKFNLKPLGFKTNTFNFFNFLFRFFNLTNSGIHL